MEPERVVVPPFYFLAALALQAFFHWVFPFGQVLVAPYRYAGWVWIAISIGVGIWAALTFIRARTPVHPFRQPAALVTEGPYRYTRNPMYLALAGMLLGSALLFGSMTPFIVIPAFMGLVSERFIHPEEERLEAAFGAAYLEYKARVRRWL